MMQYLDCVHWHHVLKYLDRILSYLKWKHASNRVICAIRQNSGNKWQNILIVLPPDLPGVPVRLLFGSREVAGGADNDKISLAKHYVRKSGQKPYFWWFFPLFFKRAGWDLLIFTQNIVQTFPDLPTRSDQMYYFGEGYPEFSYGVLTPLYHPKRHT